MKSPQRMESLDIAPSYTALVQLKEFITKGLEQSDLALQSSLKESGLPIDPAPLMPFRVLSQAIERADYTGTGYSPDCFLKPYEGEEPTVYYRVCVHTERLLSEIELKIQKFSQDS